MSLDPIRYQAWRTLSNISKGGVFEHELDTALARTADPRDRRFLAELVRGVTQWRDRYGHIVDTLSRRKGGTGRDVRIVLGLGLHQLLACDRVPSYAAVDQSVSLASRVTGRKTAPYVNGLLQNVARRLDAGGMDELRKLFPERETDPPAYLASWQSHPRWLVERWIDRFGFESAEALCRFNNLRPPLSLHVLGDAPIDTVVSRLTAAGLSVRPSSLAPRGLIAVTSPPRGEIAKLLADEPSLVVQDEAVQAATEFLGAGITGRILDMCAAPGGKTVHLIASHQGKATLTAMDRNHGRLRLVSETAVRSGHHPDAIVAADGRRAPFADAVYDAVLLDGPCSGTGVLRRHPEGRWRLRPESLTRNAARLLDLAREARRLLKPGGLLLYATCSLEPEENEGVVDSLLSEYPDLTPCAPADDDPGIWRRSWLPHQDGADGFFAVRLRREESV